MGDQMAKVIVGMTTSLDGFVNDRNGSVERLYADLEALRKTEFFARDGASTPIPAGSSAVSAFCFSSLSRCRVLLAIFFPLALGRYRNISR